MLLFIPTKTLVILATFVNHWLLILLQEWFYMLISCYFETLTDFHIACKSFFYFFLIHFFAISGLGFYTTIEEKRKTMSCDRKKKRMFIF